MTPPLAEPVVVAQFWRNRRGEFVRVSLDHYEGRPLVDVRLFVPHQDGIPRRTNKGLALAIRRLPDLAATINKALAKAQELGLLNEEGRK